MPKKLINDYIFYKIVCLDNSVELCYVGSTANWKERQRNHRNICNNENIKNYNLKIYKTIREYGGWSNFKMIQIGTREQLNRREAEQIEEEYRQELKANMNMRRCFITEEQKREAYKELCKKWCEENKDYYKEYKQNYYEKNKNKILEQSQKYREDNKDKILEIQQKHRENNKDKINEKQREKVKCECGCMIGKTNLLRHQTLPKHIKLMNQSKF